ncbi:MAG: SDR family oxidoreductase [Candidatus Sungbacteria bacterium]|nr:SDR family oxidoreductase [Candidatus Sungbacteria bacterium]
MLRKDFGINKELETRSRIALVTGGSGEIGGAIVKRFVEDGFRVILHYKDSRDRSVFIANSLGKKNKEIVLMRADISREKDVSKMFKNIKRRFGTLDVLVNNAGINRVDKHPVDLNFKDFDEMLNVNLRGSILVTKHALPLLKNGIEPRIIFISSVVVFCGSSQRIGYAASKGALLGLTRSLALALAPKILVNAVAPGYIDSRMIRHSKSEPIKKRIERIPLKRLGTPEEVAAAVSFLGSRNSSYITGQCLHINGGVFML